MRFKYVLLMALLLMFALGVSGCSEEIGVSSISINQNEFDQEIIVDFFSLEDMVLIVTMTDGTVLQIPIDEAMISDEDFAKLSTVGNHTITIGYMGLETTVDIHLVDDNFTQKLKGIYDLAIAVELTDLTYEQWLASIRGADGADGRQVALRTHEGYIQWQYVEDTTWNNLVDLSSLTGPQGMQGESGTSAYALYLEHYPDYVGTEAEWIEDLIEGRLADLQTAEITFMPNGAIMPVGSPLSIEVALHTSINLPIPSKAGYIFKGWFTGETINDQKFTNYSIISRDVVLYAKWEPITVTMTFDVNGGELIDSVTTTYDEPIAEPTPIKEGYTFDHWYTEETFTNVHDFDTMILMDTTLYAKWIINQYTITFDTGDGTAIDPITQDYHTEILKPSNPTLQGYTFEGWFIDDIFEIEYIMLLMPASNLTLYAKWVINTYTLSFEMGSGPEIESQILDYHAEIVLPIPQRIGYVFEGWFEDEAFETAFVLDVMPDDDVTIYAKWKMTIMGNSVVGYYIYLGYFPQTIASSEAVLEMGTVADDDGYFISSYDDERYALITASSYDPSYKFSTQATILNAASYYFKVEPIRWNIISHEDGTSLLLSDVLLETKTFSTLGSQWSTSGIRTWLNDNFYNTAFNSDEQQAILPTDLLSETVETTDNIFILDYSDYLNEDYGFENTSYESNTRPAMTTDYARAKGAMINTSSTAYGYGSYWVRNSAGDAIRNVYINGSLNYISYPNFTFNTLRPAFYMQFGDFIEHNVTFASDGGILIEGFETQKVIDGFYASAPVFAKPGYVFAGWDLDFEHVTTDLVVTAIWEVATEPTEGLQFVLLPDDTYEVSGYTGSSAVVFIPEMYNGTAITRIGLFAFYNMSFIISISIPDTITTIDSWAFSGCSGLTAFHIPQNVAHINQAVFSGTTLLSAFTVDALNTTYTTIDGVLFSQDQSELMVYPIGKDDTTYVIPEGVDTIHYWAFYMSQLESVIFPQSLITIHPYAFQQCYNLTSIELFENVEAIGYATFRSNYNLYQIKLHAVIPPAIDNETFEQTPDNLLIYVPLDSLSAYESALKWDQFVDNLVPILPLEEGAMLYNPQFDLGTVGWDAPHAFYVASGTEMTLSVEDGALKVEVVAGPLMYTPRFGQINIPFEVGKTYTISFDAKSSVEKTINFQIGELTNSEPWFTDFIPDIDYRVLVTTEWTTFTFTYTHTLDNQNGGLIIELGQVDGLTIDATLWFDNFIIDEVIEGEPA